MDNSEYFFMIPDKTLAGEISSFMGELKGSPDISFFTGEDKYDTVTYAFVKKDTLTLCGFLQYRQNAPLNPGNLGYILRPSLRGLGLGKMMLSEFISFLSLSGEPFVYASIKKDNIPSIKTALACGGREIMYASSQDICIFCFCTASSYIYDSPFGPILIETDPAVFSPRGADKGTLAMLSYVSFDNCKKILDLGCGTGIVGIYSYLATKGKGEIFQSDILPEAVELSRKNAERNNVPSTIMESAGFDSITEYGFDLILSNPPYHTDFSVAKNFIEKGFRHLATGGTMVMVTKRLDWYKNKLTSVFGGVKVREKDGYFVFIAEKRPPKRTLPQ